MNHRSLSACLGAVALVTVLAAAHRAAAKPPDLPMNETITVSPQAAPKCRPSGFGEVYDNGSRPDVGGYFLIAGVYDQNEAAAELLFTLRVYDALPAAVPTPTLYQLRPTARRTLAGSLLFAFHPLLGLVPTEKALDAPHDHPQNVAGDDLFSDMPIDSVVIGLYRAGRGDWCKWIMSRWAARWAAPATEQNEGYIAFHPLITIAAVTPDASAEIDAPLVPAAEALPMPREDKPHKKKHRKHHRAERLPMPQEDAAAGMTCPFLRQQADRHICQFADPQIGRDVLENLESLTMADKLLEAADGLAQAGCLGEALECCALAQDLCPGSPCADRAESVMVNLYVRACEPASGAEATVKSSKSKPGVEQEVAGLMKACRLLMNEGLHEQAAELARQAFALDPERVMADPLIYKMNLLAPARHPAGASEPSEPAECPYCPAAGKPIPDIVPAKKKDRPAPTTFLVPPMPPVDYEVVPALDRVLTETPRGADEASEEAASSALDDLIEAITGGPGRMTLGCGLNADGSVRLYADHCCAGSVYHVLFNRGCLAFWKTPDAAKTKP
jgi:hypothetical protein